MSIVPPYAEEMITRDDVLFSDMHKVCMGCCCFHISSVSPSCESIGFSGRCELLCCIQEWCCTGDTMPILCCDVPSNKCYRIGFCCWGTTFKRCPPQSCCKIHCQVCPLLCIGAFPLDDEVPCVCTICFFTLYPKRGFSLEIRELNGIMDLYRAHATIYPDDTSEKKTVLTN